MRSYPYSPDDSEQFIYPPKMRRPVQVHRLRAMSIWQDMRVEDQRMLFILGTVGFFIIISVGALLDLGRTRLIEEAAELDGADAALFAAEAETIAGLAPLFTREVRYWGRDIVRWAGQHQLDPNMVATVMQIESCGDPEALSHAGATGLFQVMPFHFQSGENMFDPNTNALRGMQYLAERLIQTRGDAGLAFAGYNGGHVAAANGWESWSNETRRYFTWSTGIYQDAQAGANQSATLQRWLEAGGASLCQQAASRLGLTP